MIIDKGFWLPLQEQVVKNQCDIEKLFNKATVSDLGIKIITAEPFPSAEELPLPYAGGYGDAFLVGTEAPYNLYIWTRENNEYNGEWFNWGQLNAPSVVPGPVGPQGIQGNPGQRGSLWNSQSGAPTQIVGVNNNDQFLNTSTGDIYQFVGGVWQMTGNIRGPKGEQGLQGNAGPRGPQGNPGQPGPKGDQGQFIQIIGTLANTSLLPDPKSVPRSYAYLITENDIEYVYLIIGEDTTTNPLVWHNAGSFSQGSGTKVFINGTEYEQLDLTQITEIPMYEMVNNQATVSIDSGPTGKITVYLTGEGPNLGGQTITKPSILDLPIIATDVIKPVLYQSDNNDRVGFQLTEGYKQSLVDQINGLAVLPEVHITAPTTATNGQFTEEQMTALQSNLNSYITFNNEVYRFQDNQHSAGYLIYTHIGYENTVNKYLIKCITITINTRGWVLTSYTLPTFTLDGDTLNITM